MTSGVRRSRNVALPDSKDTFGFDAEEDARITAAARSASGSGQAVRKLMRKDPHFAKTVHQLFGIKWYRVGEGLVTGDEEFEVIAKARIAQEDK